MLGSPDRRRHASALPAGFSPARGVINVPPPAPVRVCVCGLVSGVLWQMLGARGRVLVGRVPPPTWGESSYYATHRTHTQFSHTSPCARPHAGVYPRAPTRPTRVGTAVCQLYFVVICICSCCYELIVVLTDIILCCYKVRPVSGCENAIRDVPDRWILLFSKEVDSG